MVKCHHVTILPTYTDKDAWLFKELLDKGIRVAAYGMAYNDYIDTVAVHVNGNDFRRDGIFYHVTLSHDSAHEAKDARDVQSRIEKNRGPAITLTGSVQILERNP